MARRYCSIIISVSLLLLIGCQNPSDSGISRMEAERSGSKGTIVSVADKDEIGIVDQITINREAYKQGLEALVQYYSKVGNNAKLNWAKKELYGLNTMPQYKYIVPVVLIGGSKDYRATDGIADADLLFDEGKVLESQAKIGGIVTTPDKLRLALTKYEQLFSKYPTSDKIDDAAYKSGEISEYFKDYSFALEYYQLAYKWNPDIQEPARFRAARILDKQMHRYDEALKLYKEAMETEGKFSANLEWKKNAEERVKAIEKIGE
jgi:tetratricopeptide (TPR) repeat protein